MYGSIPKRAYREKQETKKMGIPSELRDAFTAKRNAFGIYSPNEQTIVKNSSVQDAVTEGFKTASIAAVVAAVPTLVGCRTIPWAKANLNHTAQALIISAAAISGFFITADKTILESARGNTIGKHDKSS